MISRLKFDINSEIDRIFEKLPTYIWESDSTTFCDLQMGGGQFIQAIGRWLRNYGHSDENIRKRVFGFSEKPFYLSYIKSNPSLIGTFDVYNENITMKFDVIVGNPPYQKDNGSVYADPIWNIFVEKSFQLCKDGGYISLIHPSAWRNVNGQFKSIQILIKSKNLKYLEVHDAEDGLKTFKANTPYDLYIIENKVVDKTDTKIVFKDSIQENVNIKPLEFIPTGKFGEINSFIAKENEESCNILFSYSLYEKRKSYMSSKKTKEFKYPCVRNIKVDGSMSLYYSSKTDMGHFGIPKVICGLASSGSNIMVDINGEYGLTQYAFAIIDDKDNLPLIKKALESEKFRELSLYFPRTSLAINYKLLSLFRKDFWKEFI